VTNKLQKKTPNSLKEKSQYGLTFGVIAMMLFVAGFPLVVIFFFGIFAYFLWKTFSSPPQHGVGQIFEFYLSGSAILRDDERRWFGFEVQEVIVQGEQILQTMHGAPPLVYFTLGALYNEIGNHEGAVRHLSYVVEEDHADESTYVHPSVSLKNYVRILRKIEQEPSEAPQISAAVRALERARKNRGASILEESRQHIREGNRVEQETTQLGKGAKDDLEATVNENILLRTVNDKRVPPGEKIPPKREKRPSVRRKSGWRDSSKSSRRDDDLFAERKPITEVLHDIYDKNIQ
jgi:hypothetical protein